MHFSFLFQGVGGTHCLIIRPHPVKDYLKWVFCLHKAISKIHHLFKNHKAYVYTKMKFSNFSRIFIEGQVAVEAFLSRHSDISYQRYVCELFQVPNLSNFYFTFICCFIFLLHSINKLWSQNEIDGRGVDCFKSKN